MADLSQVKEHMEIIGADGVHIGTVDKVEGDRIKMMSTGATFDVDSTGVFSPALIVNDGLGTGEVGFLTAAMKSIGTKSTPLRISDIPFIRRRWPSTYAIRESTFIVTSPLRTEIVRVVES